MREYEVVYEYVAVRASPSLRAPTLDFLRQGAVVHAVAPPDEDRWIRLHVDEERRKKYGGRKDAYMLTDGAVIGLPLLLKPVEDEETTKRKEKVATSKVVEPAPAPEPAPPPPPSTTGWGESVRDASSVALERLRKAHERALQVSGPLSPVSRVYSTSDIHTDHAGNMDLVTAKWPNAPQHSVLIVAGDVSHIRAQQIKTFSALVKKYDHVFFTPGNHDLWVLGKEHSDSVELLCNLAESLGEVGVKLLPTRLPRADGKGEILIAPMFSWYDSDFLEKDRRMPSQTEQNFDAACKWPPPIGAESNPRQSYGVRAISLFMAALNLPMLEELIPEGQRRRSDESIAELPVVAFSHFYPQPDLYYGYSGLAKVMGSTKLQDQVFALRPDVHVFGHSHLDVDRRIGNTRYVQYALGYPKDRWGDRDPKLVWEKA